MSKFTEAFIMLQFIEREMKSCEKSIQKINSMPISQLKKVNHEVDGGTREFWEEALNKLKHDAISVGIFLSLEYENEIKKY